MYQTRRLLVNQTAAYFLDHDLLNRWLAYKRSWNIIFICSPFQTPEALTGE